MKKENKLVKKVKGLLKKLNIPKFLNKFGPKIYELHEYLSVLLIKHYCKLSYRRTVELLDLLGLGSASKSSLQYAMNRIPKSLWDKALQITSGSKHHIVALDATGFSRRNPSYHYLRRIDGKLPKIPIKMSAAFDTRTKKWITAKIRVKPRHDTKDVRELLRNLECNKLVADKGYDANWIHKLCLEKGIEAHIPLRKSKSSHYRKTIRKKAGARFKKRTYNRRQLIESGNGSVKRKCGSVIFSKKAKTIRADVYCKLLCHNLLGAFSTI